MRRFHWVVMAAWLPGAALAQGQAEGDAVIRIEAKRGADVAAAVEGWQAQFPDVVTFALPRGWTGIALGPMSDDQAAARLETLKAEGKIPADSFVAQPRVALTPAGPVDAVPAEPEAEPAETAATESPAAETTAADTTTAAVPGMDMNLNPLGAPPPGVVPPGHHIRIEAFQDRSEADAALAKWRETFPGAGLWQLPNDWFAIAMGPMTEATAAAWLAAFKTAETLPKDAFLASTAELGSPVTPGTAPDLPAPPEVAAEMPPLDEVQRALRWAGVYDGGIDGKTGPKTRAAINAEIAAERLSPDPATAMTRLIERRAAWRDEMGLTQLDDAHTGLTAIAPMDRLQFDRNERSLSIYGPKDGSGAALILFSQPGGQQELVDLSGLVIALGWVPQPTRVVTPGSITLNGQNDSHIGFAEGRVRDGRAEGFVLIWPVADAENQRQLAAELSDSFARKGPAANDPAPAAPAAPAPATGVGEPVPVEPATAEPAPTEPTPTEPATGN